MVADIGIIKAGGVNEVDVGTGNSVDLWLRRAFLIC